MPGKKIVLGAEVNYYKLKFDRSAIATKPPE
jgi:hypothetical protein